MTIRCRFSHTVSQLSSCSWGWEAFPGLQTQPSQSPPLNTSFSDRKWRPWMSPTDRGSTADDSPVLHHRWPQVHCAFRKGLRLSCKGSKLTINLFCRHHGRRRTDGVVRRSCSGDIYLMWCKCWGWGEVKRRGCHLLVFGLLMLEKPLILIWTQGLGLLAASRV